MEIGERGGNFGEGVWSKEVVTIKENEVITGSNFDIFAILCYNGR